MISRNRQPAEYPELKAATGRFYRKARNALEVWQAHDRYIARYILRGKTFDFPESLLAAKRAQLQVHRLLKEKAK